ncbi:MAG: two-component system, OmpR family, sensor kinase [Frankiales bacterium]|jgi:two-component system OmpR family sensor kinase|nr:two-component system, OmpR family, sensor kinase [Frankiales bacterium]
MRRFRLRGLPLRIQLIVGLVALMALLSAVIGGVSLLALDRFQLNQLDGQLAVAETHNRYGLDGSSGSYPNSGGGSGLGPPPTGDPLVGLGSGTISMRIKDGQPDRGQVVTSTNNLPQPLTAGQSAVLKALAPSSHPRTVEVPGLGNYRVLASTEADGDIIITGLPLNYAHSTLVKLALVISLATVGGLLLAGVLGAAIVSRALRPLRRVAATADLVSSMELHKGEVDVPVRVGAEDTDRRTEVGQVGAALNQLLGHVTSALQARHDSEERVRQFVADASHELRTPLAAIRGYAELTRPSRADAPPDLAHAMERVESQAIRMSSLVEDLLLLARLDSGRPLEREEVDLSLLLVEAIGDAHAAGPDHRWDLALPEEPVVVAGDGPRLHQVVVNLLANARTHTPPGTQVTVTLDVEGDAAVVTVVDDGPGVPSSVLPDIFERFTRADTSRSRTAGSTGLGLSIVAAVVNAHRGQIWVDSVPGHTCFTVRLPLADRPALVPEPAHA